MEEGEDVGGGAARAHDAGWSEEYGKPAELAALPILEVLQLLTLPCHSLAQWIKRM